jgi:probable HAF family extracellular repeat protein
VFRRCAIVLAVLSLWSSVVAGNAWGVVRYNLTDLGTLSGGVSSKACGINNAGQVVGVATTGASTDEYGNGGSRAFIYGATGMTNLGTLSGYSGWNTVACGVNAGGQVVGNVTYGTMDEFDSIAFLYSNGTMTSLGGQNSCAYGINASGQIVGCGSDRAFLYSQGTVTYLGSGYGAATAINDGGQVVGMCSARAFLYSSGTVTSLGTFSGGGQSCGNGINAIGQVVGYAEIADGGHTHAFFYSNGTMTDIGTLTGDYSSDALGINASGQIVGYSYGDKDGWPGHAFLYSNGLMTDLNSLITTSNWTLERATAINDLGQICGYGVDSAGETHAFLLTPIPEPSSLGLLIAGAVGLLTYVWRRRRS